ncbi:Probable Na(+)/H(+) antiporter nhx [Seminavis robusta]|uniref:Probable Na(+)/H(+) antiporter nhx n=1 Tax=Seminavis robusta TaxID=568900 RepID=A0A9N8H867_9STRA|nr:Probable Na(+)/H(+) antiporter nhx [Seminavis robusta]|eukprot:Sro150_g068990.1 Probable Na(+)/H(+) antiporter nhx (1096) ;mRNA; f:94993-98369
MMFPSSSTKEDNLSHAEDVVLSPLSSTASEDTFETNSILGSPPQDKIPLEKALEDNDEAHVPVVIVPLPSTPQHIHPDTPSTNNPSMSEKATAFFLSLSSAKRSVVIIMIPLIVAVTLRLVSSRGLQMPLPQVNRVIEIDVNAPPVNLPQGQTISSLPEHHHLTKKMLAEQDSSSKYSNNNNSPYSSSRKASESLLLREQQDAIPLVVDRGEKIPIGVGIQKLSAAEALLCRDSVINYVINATNGKDECTGLQKAFDETCSQEDDDQQEAAHEEPKRQRKLRRQQLMGANEVVESLEYLLQQTVQGVHWVLSYIVPTITPKRPTFKAHDAVYRVFRQKFVTRQHHHHSKNQTTIIRRNNHTTTTTTIRDNKTQIQNQRRRRVEETTLRETAPRDESEEEDDNKNVQDDDDLTNKNTTAAAAAEDEETEEEEHVKVKTPHTSLHLPTGHVHVSSKTLEKTLLLEREGQVLKEVIKAVNATHNNMTKPNAREDAAASAKAVDETNKLVSAVLNDPTSVEARACCASILNVYHENCNVDAEEEISDKRLFIVVLIMAFCGMVKSLIRHFKIRWLPEAAGCILVGVASGYAASYFPHQDFSFDGNWFLRILVPPIVFEAALSIDKKSFNRHLVPIIIYSTVGTVTATFLTASMVYNGTLWLGRFCETIPYIESLIFGALISSIDPIAVLSVLSNMGMTDTDTLYVLVFGESLLNDGVAIVLFHTLVQFLDSNVIIDQDAIVNAIIHFFVVAMGSILVGVGSGIMCTLYFWAFHGCQTPLVEVLMFLCWALLPYYVCDGIGWSGVVTSVTVGFVLDMYVIGLGDDKDDISEHSHGSPFPIHEPIPEERKTWDRSKVRPLFSVEGHLSAVARTHIHFVTEIVATMMETAIFAYLGLFLFSHRYHWNGFHVMVSILACCVSRAIMIPILSAFANWITSMQKYQNRCRGIHKNSPATGVIVDRKMQMVLWFAGLRGAMSFALVEHIPLFDAVTGEGTRVKAELKAMTSASIMFTVFVLGGSTNYFMDYVGLSPNSKMGRNTAPTNMEMISLTAAARGSRPGDSTRNGTHTTNRGGDVSLDGSNKASRTMRPRLRVKGSEDTDR